MNRETVLIQKISQLSDLNQNTDSVQSFVDNEIILENSQLRENYEKTMERMVFLEEHLKTIGAQIPPDRFWDSR
jgi:hypothetical protein